MALGEPHSGARRPHPLPGDALVLHRLARRVRRGAVARRREREPGDAARAPSAPPARRRRRRRGAAALGRRRLAGRDPPHRARARRPPWSARRVREQRGEPPHAAVRREARDPRRPRPRGDRDPASARRGRVAVRRDRRSAGRGDAARAEPRCVPLGPRRTRTAPLDIGFRGARYLPHVGDDERNRIIDYFATATFEPPLRVDVRTNVSYGAQGLGRVPEQHPGHDRRRVRRGVPASRRRDPVGHRGAARRGLTRPEGPRPTPPGAPVPAPTGEERAPPRRRSGRRTHPRAERAGRRRRARTRAGTTGRGRCRESASRRGTSTRSVPRPARSCCPGATTTCSRPTCSTSPSSATSPTSTTSSARFRDDDARLHMVRTQREWALDGHTYAHRVRGLLDALEG